MKNFKKFLGFNKSETAIKDEYTDICYLNNVPENVSYLAIEANKKMAHSNIFFKWNSRFQHLKIENFQPSNYYEDYLMTTSYSSKMQDLQSMQVDRLIQLYDDGSLKSLVEIGCGDGSFLNHAKNKIENVWGIEPSKRFSEVAKSNGHHVINGFVSASSPLTNLKFDAFVSRQVFEHLNDPLDVLIGIKKMLNPNAVGLIEVPNGYRAIKNHRFYEFFPDHVNYFSVNSLVNLANDAGLNVIGCQESFGGDYLELWVRNPVNVEENLISMEIYRQKVIKNLKDKISGLCKNDKKIVIWGCGAKTLTIFSAGLSEISNLIAAAIDSDPNKQGLFIPNTGIKILSPEQCLSMGPNIVIVLALSYRKEIADFIRNNFPTCDLILTVDDFGKISNL